MPDMTVQYLLGPNFLLLAGTSPARIGIPVIQTHGGAGRLGFQLSWHDATSDFTAVLQLTNYGEAEAPVSGAGTADFWKDSGVTITPVAGARNSILVDLMNVQKRRARLVLTRVADSIITVVNGI